ncbi:MAG: YeeE/YedE thiosulfate transporter family protein [Piscinibacter sp.]
MNHFTPWTALGGGVLIGLAAVLLWSLNGRIAGVSGIAGGLWSGVRSERGWRLLFLLGLLLGAGGWVAFAGEAPAARADFPPALLVLAGLLVGYGTSLAGGCTSGHGVCGLARLSLRSLVAVAVFLAVAIATTFVVRHLLLIA